MALYWAEGFKKDKQLGFANSDPRMINFIIYWLENALKIKKDSIKAWVTINEDYIRKVKEIEKYWSETTGIALDNFQKPTIQKVKWKKQYENKDNYKGVLRLRVRKSLKHLRLMYGFIEGLYLNTANKVS